MNLNSLVFVLLHFGSICAWEHIPHRYRGGKLWNLIRENKLDTVINKAHIFTQLLDHFNLSETRTFQQRFYEDNTFWTDKGNPIFLYIGGEGELKGSPQGFVQDLAEMHGAKILALEHRFYGKSVPNNDLSTENLKYLQVEQALADLAYFRYVYSSSNKIPHNKWFVFGGSYPGALSAWFRVAYPNASSGALSSSGVVNAIYDFPGFDEQVSDSVGPQCASAMRLTTKAFEKEIFSGHGKEVKSLLGASELSDPDFFYMLADAGAMVVQYGHKDKICQNVTNAVNKKDSLVHSFANFVNEYYGNSFGSGCFYDTKCLKNDPSRWADVRSWRWQKCYQVAYFQVAPPEPKNIRSTMVNLTYHLDQCKEVFGDSVNPQAGVQALNSRFGADKPNAHKVFFSNGGDDPWQRASVLSSIWQDEVADVAKCDLCGHCGDLGVLKPDAPLPLSQQREKIKHYVGIWLSATPIVSASIKLSDSEETSLLVLFPIIAIFAALKLLIHVEVVRDISVTRMTIV